MSDFPGLLSRPSPHHISTHGPTSPYGALNGILRGSVAGAAAWPGANTAIYWPFSVEVPTTIQRIAWWNGATVSGNADVCLLDEKGVSLYSKGLTAVAGVSQPQVVTGVATALRPGTYFAGMMVDNITATVFRTSGPIPMLMRACGVQIQAITAGQGLPTVGNSAAFSNPSAQYMPIMVLTPVGAL